MASPSPINRISLGLGITASSMLAGFLITISTLTIPALLEARQPSTLLTQWLSTFKIGIKLGPSLALLGAVNYLSVAWGAYTGGGSSRDGGSGDGLWKIYLGAAVATLGIVPYTFILMGSTNQSLLAQTARLTMGEADVRALVEKWGSLNLGRASLPVLGTALGLYGAL